jgi:hypothetical protein
MLLSLLLLLAHLLLLIFLLLLGGPDVAGDSDVAVVPVFAAVLKNLNILDCQTIGQSDYNYNYQTGNFSAIDYRKSDH